VSTTSSGIKQHIVLNARMVHSTKSNSNSKLEHYVCGPPSFLKLTFATKFRLIPTQIGQAPLFWLCHSSKCHCFCHSKWLPATCTQFCGKLTLLLLSLPQILPTECIHGESRNETKQCHDRLKRHAGSLMAWLWWSQGHSTRAALWDS